MKEVLRHFKELQLEVKWQRTTHAVFLSAVPVVTVPGFFAVRLSCTPVE